MRIVGVDVARCVAILGMFAAHVGPHPLDGGAASVMEVVRGRSAALFALVAGVSLALLSERRTGLHGQPARQSVVRIGVRAAAIFVLGLAVVPLDTSVQVILPYYAVYFLLVLPVLSWPARRVAWLAAVWAVAGPLLSFGIRTTLDWPVPLTGLDSGVIPWLDPGGLLVDLLVTGAYSAATFMPFVLAGLALGRADLRAAATRKWALLGGAVLGLVGYGGSWLLLQLDSVRARVSAAAAAVEASGHHDAWWLTAATPHSGTPFEVVGATGVGLCVLALALLAADRWPRTVEPLAATGSLALTAYVAHLVALAAGLDGLSDNAWIVLAGFVVVTVGLGWWWQRSLGRGPLEWALRALTMVVGRRVW